MKTSRLSRLLVLVALVSFCTSAALRAATFTPTTTADTAISSLAVVNAAGQITDQGNAITLRSAVIAANAATVTAGGANTIVLGAGTYRLTIPGTGETASSGNALIGDLDVLAPTNGRTTLTVQGAGAGSTTIQQTTGIDRIFDAHPINLAGSVTFILAAVTVKGGVSIASAGAILTGRAGDVTVLTDCVFDGNAASSNGGVISQSSGNASHDLMITNCVFKNNLTTNAVGGAVNYSGIGTVIITKSTFTNNTAGTAGGAVNVTGAGTGGIYTITACNFFNNRCNDTVFGGGAIAGTQGQSLNVHFNRFLGNVSPNIVPGATTGKVIGFGGGTLSGANVFVDQNWWGVNTGPAAFDVSQIVPAQWLQLRVSASPNTIPVGGATTVTADILGLNTGGAIAAGNLSGLPGFPTPATTIFSSPVLGALSGAGTQFANGQATATFTAGATAGTGSANAAVDSQSALTALITISQPPVITNANNTAFTTGLPGVFKIGATGSPTPGLSVNAGDTFPSGVSFNPGTGNLSGTPAVGTGGSYTLHFTATNSAGTNTQIFTLTVNQPPAINSVNNTAFTVGSVGTFTVTASGFPAAAVAETGALPSGVTFNPGTKLLGGTPAAGTGGSYPITFTATNVAGTNVQNFTLTVNQAPGITCPANVTTNGAAGACLLPSVSFAATVTGFPSPAISYKLGATTITAPYVFPLGTNTITSTATNVAGTNTCNFKVVVVAGPAPQLTIVRSLTNAVVSWPTNYNCYTLQFAPALSSNTTWAAHPGPFTTSGGKIYATNGVGGTNRFFRLLF